MMTELKTKLKEYRASRDMKQGDLAELVGVRRETIGNLERGKYNPSLRLAWSLSQVLETPLDHLFSFADEDARC